MRVSAVSPYLTLVHREMHEQAMEKMLTKLDMTQGDYTVCDHPFLPTLQRSSQGVNIGLPKIHGQCTSRGA